MKRIVKWLIPITIFLMIGGWCYYDAYSWIAFKDTSCVVLGKSSELDSHKTSTAVHTNYILILRTQDTGDIIDKAVSPSVWFTSEVGDTITIGVAPSEKGHSNHCLFIDIVIILMAFVFMVCVSGLIFAGVAWCIARFITFWEKLL